MIKRPGNEDYLGKVMEEERKAYLKVLEVVNRPMSISSDGTESAEDDEGLIMIGHDSNED